MKISIDSRSINMHSGSGIGTYTKNLVFNLIHKNVSDDFILFWTGRIDKKYIENNTEIYELSDKNSSFYERTYIPKIVKDNNVDIYHIPQNGIGFPFFSKAKTIVTIHDLIPYIMPETVGKGYLKRFLKDMPNIINQAYKIITVSEYSKKDILKFFPSYPKQNIYVTPLAANNNFIPLNKDRCKEYLKKNYGIDKNFILYIGGFSSRKNVKQLIYAYKKIKNDFKFEHYLVLGGSLKDEGKKLQDICYSLGLNDTVIFPGYIKDDCLPIFYNAATCFVYPSLYEGFGLPPLEAMSCKIPVIASNVTSIPEVTGTDSAILINPNDNDELAQNILSVINNDSLKEELSIKGYNKSLQYSWRLTAEKTMDIYNHI